MDRFRRIGRSVATLPAWAALALLAVPAILAYAQTSRAFTLSWSAAEGGVAGRVGDRQRPLPLAVSDVCDAEQAA